jgi:hypothetical protein
MVKRANSRANILQTDTLQHIATRQGMRASCGEW